MTTREEILEMARKAGFAVSDLGVGFPMGEGLTIADRCERLVRIAQDAAYERAIQKVHRFRRGLVMSKYPSGETCASARSAATQIAIIVGLLKEQA